MKSRFYQHCSSAIIILPYLVGFVLDFCSGNEGGGVLELLGVELEDYVKYGSG